MGRHRPGEGMTPVAELLSTLDVEWPEGATEEYGDVLHEMNENPTVRDEVRA